MDNADTLKRILLQLNLKDLINACSTDITKRRVCETEAFWRDKYLLEGIDSVEIKDNFVKNIFQLQHIKLCEQKTNEYIGFMQLGEYAILIINSVEVLNCLKFLKLPLEELFCPKIMKIIIEDNIYNLPYLYENNMFLQFDYSENNDYVVLTITDPFVTYNISIEHMKDILYLSIYNGFVISVDVNSHKKYFY
jgi:hypothetical protein